MKLTEQQIRALLECSGFAEKSDPDPVIVVDADRHALQCDCDECLNGSPS